MAASRHFLRLSWLVVLAGVACRIDLDSRPTGRATVDSDAMSTIDGANNVEQACTINTISSLCTGADNLTDCSTGSAGCFKYIKQAIFDQNCKASACHNAGGDGKLDLSTDPDNNSTVSQDMAYANLMGSGGMGVASMVDTTRLLVVPMHPEQSYLDLMIQKLTPAQMVPPATDPPKTVGYMPQANGALCCQKQDLIDRWIRGGALNN